MPCGISTNARSATTGITFTISTLSFAAFLYQLLTGKFPYRFDPKRAPIDIILNENPVPIRDRMPGLQKEIASVIDKALVRNPKDRFPDAGKLLAAIRRITQLRSRLAQIDSEESCLLAWAAKNHRIFPSEDEECGQDVHAPVEEAVRRHFRPELMNRLTKIVHFKPLEMETAREILGKLVTDFNQRLVDRIVSVELDESAEELILREGFSKEYGARNLERVMDRLLGTLVADALLSGKITAGRTIRLEAADGRIRFCERFSL